LREAEKSWRRINGPEKIMLVLEGIALKDSGQRTADSGTANRCKTIGRFSRNSPLEIGSHQSAHHHY
jgi:hypothetical protein